MFTLVACYLAVSAHQAWEAHTDPETQPVLGVSVINGIMWPVAVWRHYRG